ncbi:MAG TPA: adenosine deaminase [Thermomicrobiales bacterium]|nr:adenosine deaminase [Thermomicrobiales bacterium]
MLTEAERDLIRRMPKAELHVHLEGSVRPETLLDLGRLHGVAYPFSDADGAREWFRFRNFPHFIEVYVAICNCLLTVDDYDRVTYELALEAHRQQIRYLEVTIAPASLIEPRNSAVPDVVIAGCRAGARRALADLGVRMQFILDAVRSRPVEHVMALAEWTAANQGDGLVGLGLGGQEVGYPAMPHAAAIRLARDRGVRISLHAGETVGPESVWDALEAGSERIGHGVTSIHDPALVGHLVERGIVLEVSPTSNLCLGVAPSYVEHPFRALYDAGVTLTVNTDDPPMFGATLTGEYLALADHCGFTLDELVELNLNAARAAFLPEAERASLVASFESEIAGLREELDAPARSRDTVG